MLSNRKIRLMLKAAVFEKRDGRKDIAKSKYYKLDYVRLQILKAIISVTVGYLCILTFFVLYNFEYLVANAVLLDYKHIGTIVLAWYLILLTVYVVGVIIGYSIEYDLSRKRLGKYFRTLKLIKRIYREEDATED